VSQQNAFPSNYCLIYFVGGGGDTPNLKKKEEAEPFARGTSAVARTLWRTSAEHAEKEGKSF
jgi:hypothetical protein